MNLLKDRRAGFSAVLALAMFATAMPAHAYIDPGTGSLLVQGIIGAVAFAAFTLRMYWHKVKRFLGLSKDESSSSQEGAKRDGSN